MSFPTASVVLLGRVVMAAGLKAAAKGSNALKSRLARRHGLTSPAEQPTPSLGANGYALAIAWQRFSDIILAMNARNPDLAQSELLAVERLTDGNRVRLMALVIFCTRRRVRELAGLHPPPSDLSALVAAHVEDYQKVICDDGTKFYRVLKTVMPGPEKMPANTQWRVGVLLPKGKAAGWLAAIRQDATHWAIRAEQGI